MDGRLMILYRGPLSSCNYGCPYCPFAKRRETAAQLKDDRVRLERFIHWLERETRQPVALLFTPWGEALTRSWYRDAITRASHMPHVVRVAAQTNLSWKLDWLDDVDRNTFALWCTYHPGETTREAFLRQCEGLLRREVSFSVGVVGLQEHREEIRAVRDGLPASVYVWVNAYKRVEDYYDEVFFSELESIDPQFPVNAVRHASLGQPCRTGESAITVDGEGDIRRCHFVEEVIGNIYQADWRDALRPRLCPNQSCGCHIGYVHLPSLELDRVYGENLLERIPLASRASGSKS